MLHARVIALVLIALYRRRHEEQNRPGVRSFIAVMDISSGRERVLWSGDRHFEAPNWSPDGAYLAAELRRDVFTGCPRRAANRRRSTPDRSTGSTTITASRPTAKMFVISAGHIYTLPSTGGTPKQITQQTPSYYHGWSPDGRMLAYCARRNDNFDLYAIPADGGEEKRLTTNAAYDDGPDYSPDGKWIYFNSDRSGSWDIWRIPADGAGADDAHAERITSDDDEDWFPHPSPDGRWMVWISFPKGTRDIPPTGKFA